MGACIVDIMKVYIERNNIQVIFIRFRKIATLQTLETLKWDYTFATDVLIAIRYKSPLVQGATGGAPDVSGRDHFGTRHFGTFSIRYIVTSGHAQLES